MENTYFFLIINIIILHDLLMLHKINIVTLTPHEDTRRTLIEASGIVTPPAHYFTENSPALARNHINFQFAKNLTLQIIHGL